MPWGRLSMDPPVKPEDDNVKFLIGMTIIFEFYNYRLLFFASFADLRVLCVNGFFISTQPPPARK